MKSLLDITILVLHESGVQCGAPTKRDELTLVRRVASEGDSFLTITLPAVCKVFDRALDSGRWQTGDLLGFKVDRQGLPRFLSGFLSAIFDSSGTLLDDPSIDCIRAVRQILLLCGKIERPTSDSRQTKALRQFVEIDSQVPSRFPADMLNMFDKVAGIIVTSLGKDFVDPVTTGLVPRHGSGAVAEKTPRNSRYSFSSWPSRLGRTFPYDQFGVVNASWIEELHSEIAPRDETPVRVVLVPKTMKTPRVISIEPAAMQWAQQGLMRWFYENMPKSPFLKRTIRFSSQDANKEAAREGSISGFNTTIDLSEASDRVSSALVWRAFRTHPLLRQSIFDCRSTRASVPGIPGTVKLRKFASMGSALCFPIEALIFTIIIAASRIQSIGCRPDAASVRKVLSDVLVYGDDIIVPVDCALSVMDWLEAFGLKVNRSKTYSGRNFRESCGGEYFRGHDVKIVRVRSDFPTSPSDATNLASWVSTTNQLYQHGLWGATRVLRSTFPLTTVKSWGTSQSSGLVWHSFSNAVTHRGWDKNLQCLTDTRILLKPARKTDEINGPAALLKSLTSSNLFDAEHLLSIVSPGKLSIKSQKVSAF